MITLSTDNTTAPVLLGDGWRHFRNALRTIGGDGEDDVKEVAFESKKKRGRTQQNTNKYNVARELYLYFGENNSHYQCTILFMTVFVIYLGLR